jgi:hypothetical protein
MRGWKSQGGSVHFRFLYGAVCSRGNAGWRDFMQNAADSGKICVTNPAPPAPLA